MILSKALRAAAGNVAPAPPSSDPQFNYVSMLLHGDGTNGAQNNTFVDSSSNNFTITRNGNTTQGSLSPYGNLWSNYFNGSTGWLTIPHNTALDFGTGDFTVEAWFNVSSVANSPGIVGKWGAGADNWLIRLETDNTVRFFYIGGSIATTQTVALNTWTHVAVTRSSGSCRVFVNGVQTGATTTVTANLTNTAANASVGAYGAGNNFFPGNISNVRVVKGTALYTSNFTPSTTPLTAVSGTSLLTCQSNRIIDNSANNFTITRNGDVRVAKEAPFLPTAAYSTSTIGGSGYFDGTGDYLTAPSSTAFNFGTGDFTVEAWINPSTVSGTKAIMGIFQGGVGGWYFGMNGASLRFSSGFADYDAGTLVANVWSHVAATVSGGNLRMFINGVQVNTTTNVSAQNFNFTNSLWVGNINTAGWTFTGYISDPRVVKGTAVYTAAFTPPTAPVTAITNTSLLLNFTNAGIFDNAAENDLETVGNAQISTSVKKYGTGSVSFNGSASTYLLTNSAPQVEFGSGNFTIEMWINFTTAPSNTVEYQLWHPVNHASGFTRLSILIYASSIGIGYFGTNVAVTSALSWTTGQWYHLAFVRNGNTWTIYRDGTSVAFGTNTSTLDVASGYYTGPRINGYIDDLRITKGYARYTANFTPPTAAFPDQ